MDQETWFGVQTTGLTFMVVLTLYVTKTLGLTKVGAFLFAFVIAYFLYAAFSINTIHSAVLINDTGGVSGLL